MSQLNQGLDAIYSGSGEWPVREIIAHQLGNSLTAEEQETIALNLIGDYEKRSTKDSLFVDAVAALDAILMSKPTKLKQRWL